MNKINSGKTKIFLDMDGTLAEFRHVDTMETLYEEGYFLNLKPMKGVIDAAAKLVKSDKYDVYILSSVLSDSKYALAEKNEWLDKHLPEIPTENRLFPPCGMPKHEWLAAFHFEADKSCILIDDYSKNLFEWELRGKGIKLMNGINGTIGSWNGARINHDDPQLYESMTEAIRKIEREGILPEFEQTPLAEQELGKWDPSLAMEFEADHEKGGEKIMKEPNEQNFTQTLLNHTENSGYTLEVHDDKLLIVDIEGPEPFREETTLEHARENACSRLEEDMKKNGEYYRKNGELDALKDDLEFLKGYDIDAGRETVYQEIRRKTELDMQKIPSFKQDQLPEQTAMNSFTGKDFQAEMTMEI